MAVLSGRVKTIFRTVGGLIVFAGILAGVLLVRSNQDIREHAAPATSIKLDPATQNVNPGNTTTLKVLMSTGINHISGLDLEIAFDPTSFQVTGVTKGSGIANLDSEIPTNKIDNTNGKILYSIYSLDSTKAVFGSNLEVLNIALTAKQNATAGDHAFTFTTNTAAAALNEGQNVVTGTTPANVRIVKIGDINNDGHVNIADIGIIVDNYFANPILDIRADVNGDGRVNIVDIGFIIDHYEL